MIGTVVRARVLERRQPMQGGIELVLHHPDAAARVEPGQFFQLAVSAPGTLLRRPYSVSWSDPAQGTLGFLFSVVGAGSAWLAEVTPGATIDILGPLGTGFALEPKSRPAIVVAGGLGIAAFPALVQRLREGERSVRLLMGARTRARLLPPNRFDGAVIAVATDDGSAGHRGPVTELLTGALCEQKDAELFVCGPTRMVQEAIRAAERMGVGPAQIQVALETPMGCGLGTCLGCAVPRRQGGFLLSCREGPCVFADRLDWERLEDTFHD